jgi:hypothetical protein
MERAIRDPDVRSVFVHGPLGGGKTSACEAAFAAAGAEVTRLPTSGVKRAWLELVASGRRVTDVMRADASSDAVPPAVLFLDDLWTLDLDAADVLAVIAATRAPYKVVMTCSSKHAVRYAAVRAACDACVEVGRAPHAATTDPYADARVVDVVAAIYARRPGVRELMRAVVAGEPRMVTQTMLENARPRTLAQQAQLMRAFLDTAELDGHAFQTPESPVAEAPYALRCHAAMQAPAAARAAIKHSQAHNRIAQHVLLRGRAAQLYHATPTLTSFEDVLARAGRVDERLPSGAKCFAAALARQLRALLLQQPTG